MDTMDTIDTIDTILNISNDYIRKNMIDIDNKLDTFVTEICKDRDETHGRNHMWKISRLSIYIANNEGHIKKNILEDILIVAWLHDVADHKYCEFTNLEQILENFLIEFDKGKLYKNIIDRISYSKEVTNGSSDWNKIIGIEGIIIRNIVSDADKIDALGENGIRRCIEYGFHKYKHATTEEMIQRVKDHAHEKILLLRDKYIKTSIGKKIAEKEHQDTIDILANLNDFFIKNYCKITF
jgi:HD superfamily phosphodiesterase